jgi:hypothetical protein
MVGVINEPCVGVDLHQHGQQDQVCLPNILIGGVPHFEGSGPRYHVPIIETCELKFAGGLMT